MSAPLHCSIRGNTAARFRSKWRRFRKPTNPLMWSGVVETDNALVTLEVPLGPLAIFDPDLGEVYFKPEQSLALTNAVKSDVGIEFLSYARFPLAHVEPNGPGWQVRLRDMRFFSERSVL